MNQQPLPKGAIIGAVVALVAILGFLIYRFTQPDSGSAGPVDAKNYAAKQAQQSQGFREERKRMMSERGGQGAGGYGAGGYGGGGYGGGRR